MVVQAEQEASLEVVQGQHAVEIYLVHTIKDFNHIIWLITQKAFMVKVINQKTSTKRGEKKQPNANLLAQEQAQVAGAEYPVPTFAEPR